MKNILVRFSTGVGEVTNNGFIDNLPTEWGFRGNEIEVNDGYHTMEELYDHRRALTVALLNTLNRIPILERSLLPFKSLLHYDGSMFEGYFICGLRDQYENKTYITYHYDLKYWTDFLIPQIERAPEYDGHSSQDVIERLLKL